jgi:hypothetical protein
MEFKKKLNDITEEESLELNKISYTLANSMLNDISSKNTLTVEAMLFVISQVTLMSTMTVLKVVDKDVTVDRAVKTINEMMSHLKVKDK